MFWPQDVAHRKQFDTLPLLRTLDPKPHGGHFGTGRTISVLAQTLVTAHGKNAPVFQDAGVGVVGQGIIGKAAVFARLDPAFPVVATVDDLTVVSAARTVDESNSAIGQDLKGAALEVDSLSAGKELLRASARPEICN